MAEPESAKQLVSVYLKKLLEERSYGRIQVAIETGSRRNTREALMALRQGKVQIVIPEIRSLCDQTPHLRIYELPFLFRDREQLHQAIDSGIGDKALNTLSDQQLILLGIWEKGTRQLLANRDLSSPQAVASEFFSGAGDAIATTFFRQLSSCQPPGQSAERRERTWREATLKEVLKQENTATHNDLTLTNHSVSGCALLTHENFWNKLPEDLKVIVADAVKDATHYARELAEQADREALKQILDEERISVHQPTERQWQLWQKTLLRLYSQQCDEVELNFIEQVAKIR